MKKKSFTTIVVYLSTFIVTLCLFSCNKENYKEDYKEFIKFKINYSLGYESGSMTRSGADIYNQFYNEYIKPRKLTPRIYEISFKNIERGDSVIVRGDWNSDDFITLLEGEYEVKGKSFPVLSQLLGDSRYIVQDTLTLLFDEKINISKDVNIIKLNAMYDCFMIFFDNKNFKSIGYDKISPEVKAYKLDNIYYMLFRYTDVINNVDKNYGGLSCVRNNGEITKLWISKFNFEKGKYYYFKDINGDYELPPMTGN